MPEKPVPKPGILGIAPYASGKSKAKPGVRVVKLSSNQLCMPYIGGTLLEDAP